MKIIEKIMKKQENPVQAAPITLAFLGDSVTQGCFEIYKTGEQSLETEFRVADGYHNKLRHLLELCYPNVPFNMIHAGISGDTVSSGLARAERDVLAYHPDLTVVSFGLNDSCLGGKEGLEQYKQDLQQLLTKLRFSGGEVIFMTQNLMADRVSPEVGDPFFQEVFADMTTHYDDFTAYMEAARSVCATAEIPLCDCTRKWETLKKNGVNVLRLLANRINHPIEELHWLFAVSLFEMIQGM